MGVFKGDEEAGDVLEEDWYKRPLLHGRFLLLEEGRAGMPALCLRVRKGFFSAGLIINVPKCCLTPALVLRQLGFDVDMGEGNFRAPVDRWEALQSLTDYILSTRGGRVQARKLASLAGTVISMRMAWGPVT